VQCYCCSTIWTLKLPGNATIGVTNQFSSGVLNFGAGATTLLSEQHMLDGLRSHRTCREPLVDYAKAADDKSCSSTLPLNVLWLRLWPLVQPPVGSCQSDAGRTEVRREHRASLRRIEDARAGHAAPGAGQTDSSGKDFPFWYHSRRGNERNSPTGGYEPIQSVGLCNCPANLFILGAKSAKTKWRPRGVRA